jgi:prepilin-type N-terminal cleavage/methylation domain-containing protein
MRPPRAESGSCTSRRAGRAVHPGRGFSLVELLVVLAVAMMMTGLLLPAMSHLRENAHRVVCSSNLRQIGLGVAMYALNNDGELPYSEPLHWENPEPQELMAANRGVAENPSDAHWDGLGLLFAYDYCKAAPVFYCPSHRGRHPFERYEQRWRIRGLGEGPLYINYHYAGDVNWGIGGAKRSLDENLVLATDGLRTKMDFNHEDGMNVLSGDGSVVWNSEVRELRRYLPDDDELNYQEQVAYRSLWKEVENRALP